MKPTIHLCNHWCWWKCRLGQHNTPEPEAKCLCCLKFDKTTAHELARSARSEVITLDWHRQQVEKIHPDSLLKNRENRIRLAELTSALAKQ